MKISTYKFTLHDGVTHEAARNTIFLPYKPGDALGQFDGGGAMLLVNGGRLVLREDSDTFTTVFDASGITVTWHDLLSSVGDTDDVSITLDIFNTIGATGEGGTPSAPTGPAGGDLAGNYPNPVLRDIGPGGTLGGANAIPTFSFDTKGRVTGGSSIAISFPPGSTPLGPAGGDLQGTYPDPLLKRVANAKLTDMLEGTFKGRMVGAGVGPPQDLTGAQVASMVGVQAGRMPVGTVIDYAGTVVPAGYLDCNGQFVSKVTYAVLFGAIGSTYGDSGGNFGLPDLRGRVIAGLDNQGGTIAGRLTGYGGIPPTTLGGAGGGEYYVQSYNEMAVHAHGLADPGHTHSVYDPTHAHGVADPQHVHGLADPGHAHSLYDPGHGHGVGDPGHAHTSVSAPNTQGYANTAGVNSGFWVSSPAGERPYNVVTTGDATGIWIGASGTGMGVYGAATGQYVFYNPTNIGIYGNYASVSNYASGTGQWVQNAGANWGASNMQPTMLMKKIIYTGV